MGPKLVVLATLVLAVTTLTVVFTFDTLEPPEPALTALGSAVVQSEEASLVSTADGSGKLLMKLPKGSKVNLLDKLSTLDVPMVRVQFLSGQKNSKPGYIRTTDLGSWESTDPASEWAFLAPSRGKSQESEDAMRKFITQLRSFSMRFPGTTESEKALIERAGLHLKLAKTKQQAGQPKPEWEPDVTQAQEAIAAVPPAIASQAEASALKSELDALLAASPKAAEPPKQDQSNPQLQALLRSAKLAWDAGDLNGCESFARKALAVSANNTVARGFLYQVTKAREALKD